MGATVLVNAAEVNAVETIREATNGGVDFSLDCTGRAANLIPSISAVRSGVPGIRQGGSAVLVGLPRVATEIDPHDLVHGQKTLLSALGGWTVTERDFPTFVSWYQTGSLDLESLVTNRYSLQDLNEAVADLREGRVAGRAVLEF
jgi:Zn-dependent alcohol dehydrogenase